MSCSSKDTKPVRQVLNLNGNWKFFKGPQINPTNMVFDHRQWTTLNIPHDWAFHEPFEPQGNGDNDKLPWKAEGWYRKHLEIPADFKGKNLTLLFDGVMAFPEIYVNGTLVGKWDYGYNSFYVDVTDHVNFGGQNILTVYADTHLHDSRWYPGGDIYSKVQMLVTNPLHVDVWGTYITTPSVDKEKAKVSVQTSIVNNSEFTGNATLEHTIFDSVGIEIDKTSETLLIESESFQEQISLLTIDQPKLWNT